MSAAAWVHRRDQLDARGKAHMRVGPRDADGAGLQRLAQRIEHRALELRQFIQEQHAQVGETHLPRPDAKAPAHQRGHRGRVMRRPVGPRPRHPAARERACDRSDHRDLQRLAGIKRREDAGKAGREQRLARTRRAHHQQVGYGYT